MFQVLNQALQCLIRLSSAQNMVWFHEGANDNHSFSGIQHTSVGCICSSVHSSAHTCNYSNLNHSGLFNSFYCSYYSLFRWFHTYIAILLVGLVILSLYSPTWIHLQYLTNLVSLVSSWIWEKIPNSIFSYKYSN